MALVAAVPEVVAAGAKRVVVAMAAAEAAAVGEAEVVWD